MSFHWPDGSPHWLDEIAFENVCIPFHCKYGSDTCSLTCQHMLCLWRDLVFPSACICMRPYMHPAGYWILTSCQGLFPRPGAATHPPSLPSQRCECLRFSLNSLAPTAPRLLVLSNSSWRTVAPSQDFLTWHITYHADLFPRCSGLCFLQRCKQQCPGGCPTRLLGHQWGLYPARVAIPHVQQGPYFDAVCLLPSSRNMCAAAVGCSPN